MRRGKRERALLKEQWSTFRRVKWEVIRDNLSNDPPQPQGKYATARSFESTLHAARPMRGGTERLGKVVDGKFKPAIGPAFVAPPKASFPEVPAGKIVRVYPAGPNHVPGKPFARVREVKPTRLTRT